jgi:hypothetical protein
MRAGVGADVRQREIGIRLDFALGTERDRRVDRRVDLGV